LEKDEMGRACRTQWGEKKCILVENAEGKRPLGKPRRRWEDNIKMDLRGMTGVVWTGLIWFRIGTV
jgi:hypothetical protein